MKVNKLLYGFVVLLFSQQVFAQIANTGSRFTLKGKLTGPHIDTIFVSYQSDTGKFVYQAKPVINNEFIISGIISNPVEAVISFKTNGETTSYKPYLESTKIIYLEAGKLTITGNASNPPALILNGSKSQADLDELDKETLSIHEGMNRVDRQFNQYQKEKNKAKLVELHAAYEGYADKEKDVDYKFFLSHSNSYITANKVLSYTDVMGLDSLKKVYNNFSKEIKVTHLGAKLASEIKKMQSGNGTPGSQASAFTAIDINGKPLSLADFKGKYVIVDFWASWCVPCRKGNPHMISLYNNYKSKGLDIISVSNDGGNAWKNAVEQDKVNIWHNVFSGLPSSADYINNKYGVRTLPTKILIDPNGKIIGRFGDNLGGTDEDMDKMLTSILNK